MGAFGGLDAVVCNAGTGGGAQWPEESDEDWQAILDLNLNGMFYTCRAAWPHLVARGGGAIVAITSLSGVAGIGAHQLERMGGFQPSPSYQASKAAMEGLVQHLAGRGGEQRHPASTRSDPAASSPGSGRRPWARTSCSGASTRRSRCLPRHGRSEDIAEAVLYMASDAAKFTTGAILDVNGGAIGKV